MVNKGYRVRVPGQVPDTGDGDTGDGDTGDGDNGDGDNGDGDNGGGSDPGPRIPDPGSRDGRQDVRQFVADAPQSFAQELLAPAQPDPEVALEADVRSRDDQRALTECGCARRSRRWDVRSRTA